VEAGVAREPFCYLTTIGRRSGEPRRIEIWFAAAEAAPTIYLLAGGGERAGWVRNLRRQPRVAVEIGDRRLAGTARVLGPGDEDALARRLLYEKYREGEDELEEWRDTRCRSRSISTGSDQCFSLWTASFISGTALKRSATRP
jgi:deazaflavin-dependent oxidoreductase (nitroreductase family)